MTDHHGEHITAELLNSLLAEADRIAEDAHDLLAPMGQIRHDLRQSLRQRGMIVAIGAPDPAPISLAAVDGGSVREPLYVADLMVILATSAEGMTSTGGHRLHHEHWCQIVAHEAENDRVLSAAMAAHELALLSRLEHDLRILDGSSTSPIVTLNHALNVRSATAQDLVVDLITDEVLQAVWELGDPGHRTHPGRIVALPKSDSSTWFVEDYSKLFTLSLPGGDRFMAAQVLERGEMLYPRHASEHEHVQFHVPRHAPEHVQAKARDLIQAAAPIRKAAAENRLVVTYLKPDTADTVLKVELMVPAPLAPASVADHLSEAVDEVRLVARYLSDETPGPHMQEPYAQYAVDLAAKSVSVGSDALNQAMLAALPDGAESYLPLLVRSYRTRASTGGQRPGTGVSRPGNGGAR